MKGLSVPKVWLYYIALVLPLALSILISHTSFVDWLWYHGYADDYYRLAALKVQPQFAEFVGGWAMPVFVGTVLCYWSMDYGDEKDLGHQFILLPLVYAPFTVIGHFLETFQLDTSTFYAYPLIVIPCGYLYVLPWVLCIWVFSKLKIVM